MTCPPISALRIGLGFVAFVLPTLVLPAIDSPLHVSSFAAPADSAEKEAFEAAKALGTVEAWDAFLSHYPSGFHADLARAYVKKLAEPQAASPSPSTAAAPTVSANDDFPAVAASWGGVVRDGPGQQYRKIGSLAEGEPVTLMARTEVFEGDFPWFKIAFKDGKIGYQWGGILCSTGAERPDIFKTCMARSPQPVITKAPTVHKSAKKKRRCPAGEYLNQLGACQPNETGQ
jgi:hypothetical protein